VACPQCSSRDVFYSCKPECCFNHVCNSCYTTFELETTRIGEAHEEFPNPPEPDATNPTAPCARCGDCKVFAVSSPPDQKPVCVCVGCKALLTLSAVNVAKG